MKYLFYIEFCSIYFDFVRVYDIFNNVQCSQQKRYTRLLIEKIYPFCCE